MENRGFSIPFRHRVATGRSGSVRFGINIDCREEGGARGLKRSGAIWSLAAAAVGVFLMVHALPAGLLRTVGPERVLETAVRLELGAVPQPREQAVSATPTPEPQPEPTFCSESPDQTPEGLPILPASFPGGLTMKNETDYDPILSDLLAEGPGIRLPSEGVQVLILHTHTSEAYTPTDSDRYEASDTMRTEDANYNIIRVGDVLAQTLEDAGLTVLHDRTVYDYPSYTGSYTRSGAAAEAALAEHPEIAVVIDLHRDALCSDSVVYKTVAELPDGEAAAQVMFVVGTDGSGLEHPDWLRNLHLAVYLQDAVDALHPTLMRPINLVNQRYNQHLSPGMLLIEVGSSGNTLQEAIRAVQLFGSAAGPALAALRSE